MAAAVGALVRDPGLVHGDRFRVLQQTTGLWFVYDPELPFGRRTARGQLFEYSDRAVDLARDLAAAAKGA